MYEKYQVSKLELPKAGSANRIGAIPSTYADLPRGRTIMGSTCANFGIGVQKIEEGDIHTMAATGVLVDDGSSL